MRLVLQSGHELVEKGVEVVVELMQHAYVRLLRDYFDDVFLQSNHTQPDNQSGNRSNKTHYEVKYTLWDEVQASVDE